MNGSGNLSLSPGLCNTSMDRKYMTGHRGVKMDEDVEVMSRVITLFTDTDTQTHAFGSPVHPYALVEDDPFLNSIFHIFQEAGLAMSKQWSRTGDLSLIDPLLLENCQFL